MTSTSHDPVQLLRDRFISAMRAALGPDCPPDPDPLIGPARNPKFGDYQSNAAMPLGKALGRPPREIAQQIVDHLDLAGIALPPDDSTIAGPGFINIRLAPDAYAGLLDALDTPDLGVEKPAAPETIVVDLCGVNLAKQMHVGHLRATVIGDALARIFERLGHRVIRQNHVGDWGLPIAMVTAHVADLARRGTIDLDKLTLDDLDTAYRAAQRDCSPDRRGLEAVRRYDLGPKAEAELEEQVAGAEEALERAKQTLIRLQSHDGATVAMWQRIADVTMSACHAICRRLHANVPPESAAGESTYRDELAGVVDDLVNRGLAVESDGALVIDLKDAGIAEPLLIRKSDGGFLYATTDLAGIRRRVQKLGADRCVYAVDARQGLHFKQAFAGAIKAGYARKPDGSDARLEHAAFGTVLGEDNKPFKTRSGENVKLSDLLDEAVVRAGEQIKEKNPDLPADEQRKVAEAVGISAIKYADLSSDRVRDYVFSFDRMLMFEGDTGPYLLYALVRIRSIFRNAAEQFGVTESDIDARRPGFALDAPEERALALALLQYPGVLESTAEALEPHRLCTYLRTLAEEFSRFFQQCPVLKAPDEATRGARLRLCRLTGKVLGDGLTTLGLIPVERM
ncbi:MAG: arginine--tRNA ligase [Phycisphaeraceae bacterium]|nr:arginine--tRNA ligase [Phycisphaeraceae bacterium]MCB9848696.1 arginine--tRNA ligase [Phycisphaeraceae bacterium]